MIEVVSYRFGERLPADGEYLLINRVSRTRGCEYYIAASPGCGERPELRLPPTPPGYASKETALDAARKAAAEHGFRTIYMELASV